MDNNFWHPPWDVTRRRGKRAGIGRLLALLVSAMIVAAGCASDDNGETATSDEVSGETSETAPDEATGESESGEPASIWDGEFQTIAGESIDLSAYADADVVLWFWAPW